MKNKILHGQFFTKRNPFESIIFEDWFNSIPLSHKQNILEPFAGECGLSNFIDWYNPKWHFYDIEPRNDNIIKNDSINNFPKGFKLCITNPPYLSKVSASKKKIEYHGKDFDNVYKKCLEQCLNNCDYVAIIIPESFLESNIFTDRLYAVISLNPDIFDDTGCPICLCLFNPYNTSTYIIERQNGSIITKSECDKYINNLLNYETNNEIIFNESSGQIGIKCVDNTKTDSIIFCNSSEIKNIKNSSRNLTIVKIKNLDSRVSIDNLINNCNILLKDIRKNCLDVGLSPFKSIRQDGLYRRRLSYGLARKILLKAIELQ